MHGHLSEAQLTALAEECLAGEEEDIVSEHIRECEWCREKLRKTNDVRLHLRSAAASQPLSLEDGIMNRIAQLKRSGEGPATVHSRWFDRFGEAWSGTALRAASVAIAVVVIAALIGVFYYQPTQAWSLEQSIEAVQTKRAVHLSGSLLFEGSRLKCQMWLRGREGESRVHDQLLRAENGAVVWVQGNATYVYVPPEPVVYTDDAQTAGMTHWPGAAFLELVKKIARKAEVSSRFDFFAGRRLVVFEAQIIDVGGPKSFVLEFDPSSKLLVGLKSWNNLDKSGPPDFEADEVTYLDSAPDSLFHVGLPAGVVYRQRPVSIAPEAIGLLAVPSSGLSLPRVSGEEASRKIVEAIYAAQINADWATFRRLAPLASLWDDEQLKTVLGGVDGQEAIVEVVEVGKASLRGHSALGPLVVVQSVVRHKDGRLFEDKIIVQVRQGAGDSFSCVVYGPYGVPYPQD